MSYLNVEIKARTESPELIRRYLLDHDAEFRGTDEQTDTYFNVAHGRLKLREGIIENNLIYYDRDDQAGPKSSHFNLIKVSDTIELKEALAKSCGIKMIVRKTRDIYYLENVKFHIDRVAGLGCFVEIEAGNLKVDKSEAELREQCNFYLKVFGIHKKDLIAVSYSDMMSAATI